MRIDSGTIGMDSARLRQSSTTLKRSVTSDVSGNNTTGSQLTSTFTFSQLFYKEESTQITGNVSLLPETVEEEYDPLEEALSRLNSKSSLGVNVPKTQRNSALSEFQKMHEKFIQNILELLFRRHKAKSTAEAEGSECNTEDLYNPNFNNYELVSTTTEFSAFYSESEYTTFSATGMIHTEDGRDIDVNISISMSSRFTESYSEFTTGMSYQLIDPLVINLKDAPAGLTDLKYFFDIDADGELDEISQLTEGSGFLALDKNNDGIINDGSELFGTKSGDGFADLAAYDEDHNGFIDENDSVFEKLKIYTKDENGKDILYTLKEAGVGAIALQNSDTQFTLGSSLGAGVNGVVRRTGIFLYENGNVGTIQHLDLAT